MKISRKALVIGLALAGVIAAMPSLPNERVLVFNEKGDRVMDSVLVTHYLDLGPLHISTNYMEGADLHCTSVVLLPSTTFLHCNVRQ